MRNAMIIDKRDNVAVAIDPIFTGDTFTYACGGEEKSLTAREDITIYHKVATRNIAKGEPVIKYGEHIGVAVCDIQTGEHVHVHNVEGHRENLKEKE